MAQRRGRAATTRHDVNTKCHDSGGTRCELLAFLPPGQMPYCRECDRHFESQRGLLQHCQDSSRHAANVLAAEIAAAAAGRPSAQTSPEGSFWYGFRPASPVTETVCDTTEDEPSKDFIISLKEYDGFTVSLIVPPCFKFVSSSYLELADVDNAIRPGSTPAGDTLIS